MTYYYYTFPSISVYFDSYGYDDSNDTSNEESRLCNQPLVSIITVELELIADWIDSHLHDDLLLDDFHWILLT